MTSKTHNDSETAAIAAVSSFLSSLSIPTEPCVERLLSFATMIQAESKTRNITKYTTLNDIFYYHFLDGLQVLKYTTPLKQPNVIDIGTGPGLPGIPCAIAMPGCKLTLLDSNNRNVSFINRVINELGLSDCVAYHARAEDQAHVVGFRASFDIALARAVAHLPSLLELCLPFLKPGGVLLTHRGVEWNKDLDISANALSVLNAEFVESYPYVIPGRDSELAVLAIRLLSPPKAMYPRSPARIKKSPIL